MRVVCISDNWAVLDVFGRRCQLDGDFPKKGSVYTVTGKEKLGIWCYSLTEFSQHRVYQCSHFRPVTDITELEKLLIIEPVKEDADA